MRAARIRLLAAGLGGGALAVLSAGGGSAAAAPHLAAAASVNFTSAATAPVMQITEDEPNAQFHPEGDGDFGYTLVTANPGLANATAALVWPGSAAANAGTLVALLGGPSSLSALNDPVQASAATGGNQTSSSITAPTGSTMSASVVPTGPTDQHATATSVLAGGGLGAAGSVGSSSSTSTIDYDSNTGVVALTAHSQATKVDVGGVVTIGSVTSSASATSTDGLAPTMTGATDFHGMSIAGQQAYLDGSGVHVGAPGAPAGPAAIDSVDAALASAGMEVYFTAPHTITVGGVSYYYSATVLFFWAPPGDTSHNSFTMSLGGAAVSVSASPEGDFSSLFDTSSGGSSNATTAASSSAPVAAGPVSGSSSPTGAAVAAAPSLPVTGGAAPTLSLPASPAAAAASTAGHPEASVVPVATRLPGGIGVGWWILAALAAIAGAGLTTRVPALLQRQAAATCPRARNPRSSPGK